MSPSTGSITESPELLSGSLAHVLRKEDERISIIGQAWLVSPGTLVTCGHVVEPFLRQSGSLVVKFPSSGNEYQIDSVRLHPSFLRQQDQLIKYDVALLSIRVKEPELSAPPLPLIYDVSLRPQQPIWTIRYPAHLGAISSSPDPLMQTGNFLGHLRKNDHFHLLHDMALAPGDSGAPIFIEDGVVGIHCGDTASLPGLNVATTAIRLALWGDALRELGVTGRSHLALTTNPKARLQDAVGVFFITTFLAFILSMVGVLAMRASEHIQQQHTEALAPVTDQAAPVTGASTPNEPLKEPAAASKPKEPAATGVAATTPKEPVVTEAAAITSKEPSATGALKEPAVTEAAAAGPKEPTITGAATTSPAAAATQKEPAASSTTPSTSMESVHVKGNAVFVTP